LRSGEELSARGEYGKEELSFGGARRRHDARSKELVRFLRRSENVSFASGHGASSSLRVHDETGEFQVIDAGTSVPRVYAAYASYHFPHRARLFDDGLHDASCFVAVRSAIKAVNKGVSARVAGCHQATRPLVMTDDPLGCLDWRWYAQRLSPFETTSA
jgi:hypothetical protein